MTPVSFDLIFYGDSTLAGKTAVIFCNALATPTPIVAPVLLRQ